MHTRILFYAVLLGGMLSDPQTLFAWGPATHVQLAGDLLSNLGLLPAALGLLLSKYARDYLCGVIATDVVIAKRLSRIKQFCHHWSTGFRLLDEAEDDAGRAFAYGYLSHLAGDTVAHGKFVPYQIVATGTTVNFGHFYWELRADAQIGERAWAELESVLATDLEVHHALLARVLTETLLPYRVNQVLFTRMNALAADRRWRRSVERWERWSRRLLSPDLLARYHVECTERTLCLLTHGVHSPILHEDPSGTAALAFAADARRTWRRRRRRGLPLLHRPLEAAAGHLPAPWPPPRTCPV